MEDVLIESRDAQMAYRTDSSGQWVLYFPNVTQQNDVGVQFTFADGSAENRTVTLEPGKTTVISDHR